MASGPALVYADLSFPIHRVRNAIGRRNLATGIVPTIDLTPLDRDRVVSRRHAEIVHREGIFFIVDVQARNGVFVNGDRLPSAGERQLQESDSVSFGGVALTFHMGAAWPDGLCPEWERPHDPVGFDAISDVTITAASTLSGQLHDAIEQNQFLLYYQPKVSLTTGRLEAAECLLRWKHPELGMVSPDRFLPLAESTGFIKAITSWVLETALTQLAEWHSQGLNMKLAVNISTRDLEDDRLAERVSTLLRATGVPAGDLIIEMTETGLMNDPKRSIRNLGILKETRVRLSIDDFGIGQSSLAYLRQLPADELKIDKSFCMSIDANNLAILRSAINVGHDLGMRVTAEGIETESAMAALRELGCDLGQGYHFGAPVPADSLADSPLARTAIDSTAPGWVLGRKHH
jgi:EAL domain-containing protein (putative c-di-GMP-specific phosphodiesterase class I)